MIKRLIGLFFFALFLIILGCAKPHVMLDQVIVLNTTESKITDVRIFHEPTLRSAEVNAILPQRSLDIGFSGQPMLGKKGTVSWRDGAGVKREMTLELPHDHSAAREGRSMNLVYIIDSSGTVAAHLETPINSND